MEERDKLIEAARVIQENCEHTESGNVCPFAYGGVCNGEGYCGVSGYVPARWFVPKLFRWTEQDYNLAKALDDFGVDVVEKCRNDGCVRFGYNGNVLEKKHASG